jgi:transposase InsO family protein
MSNSTYQSKIIKNKLGLIQLAQSLGNVSQACRVMGYSRDSFYRYKDLYDNGGDVALQELTRRKPCPKNRVDAHIEQAVIDFAFEQPAFGQVRVSNELRKKGVIVSAGGVRSIWLRNNLETFQKRLRALESRVSQEGLILTENQIKALERAKEEKVAHGEIETEHPGYLVAQDTYYIGTIKGVGRIYQQTVIDTYTKVAFVKVYDRKNSLVAADILNDKVLPWFEDQGVRVLRMLTDRGTEYCGKVENHDFELYLAIEDIDHTKTKAKSPQTNGICERFHQTIQNEFYAVAFRKKVYEKIEQLQEDVDKWIEDYNGVRSHSGKYCFGKTPLATFEESKHLAIEKMLNYTQPTANEAVG